MDPDPIRVLLADDHTLFRRGLRTLLEQLPGMEVVGEAATGREAVERARDLVPDVVLMDIKMPELSGIEAARRVTQENPHIGVILVTMFDDPDSVFSGMRAGARGYVLKEAEPEELRRAIEAAARGEVLLGPKIAEQVLAAFGHDVPPALAGQSAPRGQTGRGPSHPQPAPFPYEALTQREREVLQLAADGLSNRQIAEKLVISEKTVKNHVANIFSKLQVNDRTQAILHALRHGLVTVSPAGNIGELS
ncbi:MAG: response regulator [Chloroflexota bacterium]